MDEFQSVNVIAIDPDVRNGRPHIAGTTIEVSAIAIATIVHKQSPEAIASDYNLSLTQVHGALAYYYAHKADIDASINYRHELAQQLKEQILARQPALIHRRELKS